MASKNKFTPADTHFVSLDSATSIQSTLTLFGKLISDAESKPAVIGLAHPSGEGGTLHRSLVFGIRYGNQCQTLSQPQQVWLPSPDGPADGCGWDPTQYVVWRNIPTDWPTLHVVTTRKPISAAVAAGIAAAPRLESASRLPQLAESVGAQVTALVQQWAQMPQQPNQSDVLANLWTTFRATDFATVGAQLLLQLLNNQLGVTIPASAITSTLTVSGLIALLA
jgi:hypothetical protein